jgi:hypothetical protein
MEHCLGTNRPRRERGETGDGIAEHVPFDGGGRTGGEVLDVDAEDLGGTVQVGHVLARLPLLLGVEDQKQSARHRPVDHALSEAHLEAQGSGLRRRRRAGESGSATEGQGDRRGDKEAEHGATLARQAVARRVRLPDRASTSGLR